MKNYDVIIGINLDKGGNMSIRKLRKAINKICSKLLFIGNSIVDSMVSGSKYVIENAEVSITKPTGEGYEVTIRFHRDV